MNNRQIYKIIRQDFKTKEFDREYNHVIFNNPFKGTEGVCDVINFLVKVAEEEVIPVCDSYAYAYAMATFGTAFFPRNMGIMYIYETQEDYDNGVPSYILWEYQPNKER